MASRHKKSLSRKSLRISVPPLIAVVRAAQRGLVAALVPAQLCNTMFESGTLVLLFEHQLETADAYYFACGNQDADNKDVRLLRDWSVATFAKAG